MVEHSKYCQWPAKIAKTLDLGYVEDTSGRQYPRDIGCSSAVNGHVVIQFGDTFGHDGQGDFVGITCSDVAIVQDPQKPQFCTYLVLPDGTVPTNPPPISSDLDDENYRTTTWCFGGTVFPGDSSGSLTEGYTFFQCSHINKIKFQELIQYTGIAKVLLDTAKNQISMTRDPQTEVFFTISEPTFGSFTAHIAENYLYTYGHAANTKDVMLARVTVQNLLQKAHYEFFDGTCYQKNLSKCKPVMTGCNAFGDGKVQIGVAPKPEGPWDIRDLMPASAKAKHEDSSFTYCMYAHPWAYDEADGEIMITWSEGGIQGKVVAVKVSLIQAGHS